MKRFIIALITVFSLCFAVHAQNNLLSIINDKLPNGNYKHDNFPITRANVTTNIHFSVSPIIGTNELWEVRKLDLYRNPYIPQSNCVFTIVVLLPYTQEIDKSGKWNIYQLALGNDNKWHYMVRRVTSISIEEKASGKIVKFSAKFTARWLRYEMWGTAQSNIYLKPVDGGGVDKFVLTLGGKLVSKYAYSKKAQKFFMAWDSNKFDDETMQDEFMISE